MLKLWAKDAEGAWHYAGSFAADTMETLDREDRAMLDDNLRLHHEVVIRADGEEVFRQRGRGEGSPAK